MGAIALGVGLTACNKEEAGIDPNAPEATMSVKVVPDAGTRAKGDISGDGINTPGLTAESAIKKLQVWVFAGNTPNGYGESTTSEVKQIATNVGPRDIFIVVNGKGLSAATTRAQLEAATENVPVNIDNGLTMTCEKISATIKTGLNTIGYGATTADQNSLKDTPEKVTRINARVAIASAVLNLPDGYEIFTDLKDVEVAMFNVPETTKIFDPASFSGDWLYGEAWPSPLTSYNADKAVADFKEGAFTLPIPTSNAPYFYVNPCDATGKMIIVLRGKPYKGDTPVVVDGLYTDDAGYTYYPVWVNATKTGYSYTGDNTGDAIIRRNTQYNIHLTIKKIGNPTIDPLQPATLDVKVEVEPWKVVKQDVVWQ